MVRTSGFQLDIGEFKSPRSYVQYSEVAQLVEQSAVNRKVAGSTPAFGANRRNCHDYVKPH